MYCTTNVATDKGNQIMDPEKHSEATYRDPKWDPGWDTKMGTKNET